MKKESELIYFLSHLNKPSSENITDWSFFLPISVLLLSPTGCSCSGVTERGRVNGERALGHRFTLGEAAQEPSPDIYPCAHTWTARREPAGRLQRRRVQWTNPRSPVT